MAVVQLEPTKEHPVPYDLSSDKTPNLREEIAVAGNTAELQEALGAPLDVTERDAEREKELLRAVAERRQLDHSVLLVVEVDAVVVERAIAQNVDQDGLLVQSRGDVR